MMEISEDMFKPLGEAGAMRSLKPLPSWPNDTFVAQPFQSTPIIQKMHNWPRAGLTNDIAALASDTSSTQKDYIIGIVVGSLIILGVAIVWLLVLLILKCLGRRVGCASGQPRPPKRPAYILSDFPSQQGFEVEDGPKNDTSSQDDSQEAADQTTADVPSSQQGSEVEDGPKVNTSTQDGCQEPPDPDQTTATKIVEVDEARPDTKSDEGFLDEKEYNAAMEDWRLAMKRHEKTMILTRITFMFAGLAAIIASILFFTKGAGSLIDSISSVQIGLDMTDRALTDAINVSETFARSQELVNEEKIQFSEDAKFCNATVAAGSPAEEVQRIINDLALASKELTTGFIQSANGMTADFYEARELSQDVSRNLDQLKPYFFVAVVFAVILDVIILSLMMSIGFVWAGKQPSCHCFMRCIRNVLVIPILIIFMFLAWLFCSIFVIAAVAAADFCDDVDSHALSILENYEENFTQDSIVLAFLKYYVSACNEDYEPIKVPDMVPEGFTFAVEAVHAFLEWGSTSSEFDSILNEVCGENSINELASVLHDQLHVLYGALVGLANILMCGSLNPIYASVVHQGACINGVNGLAWIFSSQFIIAISCMIMVTLRASWYEVEEDEEEQRAASDKDVAPDEKDEEEQQAASDNDVVPEDFEPAEGTADEEGFRAEEQHE